MLCHLKPKPIRKARDSSGFVCPLHPGAVASAADIIDPLVSMQTVIQLKRADGFCCEESCSVINSSKGLLSKSGDLDRCVRPPSILLHLQHHQIIPFSVVLKPQFLHTSRFQVIIDHAYKKAKSRCVEGCRCRAEGTL